MTTDALLRDARVRGAEEPVDVRISGDRIASIEPSGGSDADAMRVFDLEGRVLLPGFVNAHAHLDKAFLLWTATDEVEYRGGVLVGPMQEAKLGFSVEDVKERAARAVRWAIETGTTAIRTHIDVDPFAELKGVQAVLEVKWEFASMIDIQTVAFAQEGMVDEPDTVELMEQALAMGVNLVGGKPSADEDPRAHIDIAFDLARRFDRGIDVHVDTDIDHDYGDNVEEWEGTSYPGDLESYHLARRALDSGYEGRIAASHLCALDSLDMPLIESMVSLLHRARADVISCPSSNLYLMGLGDPRDTRRGITRVHDLMAGGVRTAYGTDNFGDAFNVYGTPDMVLHGLLTAFGCQMRTVDDLWTVVEMGTTTPAAMLGLEGHGVEVGGRADLVVLDADSLYEGITRVVPRHLVLKGGRPVFLSHRDEVFLGPA